MKKKGNIILYATLMVLLIFPFATMMANNNPSDTAKTETTILEQRIARLGDNSTSTYVKFENYTGIYEIENGELTQIKDKVADREWQEEWNRRYKEYYDNKERTEREETNKKHLERITNLFFSPLTLLFSFMQPLFEVQIPLNMASAGFNSQLGTFITPFVENSVRGSGSSVTNSPSMSIQSATSQAEINSEEPIVDPIGQEIQSNMTDEWIDENGMVDSSGTEIIQTSNITYIPPEPIKEVLWLDTDFNETEITHFSPVGLTETEQNETITVALKTDDTIMGIYTNPYDTNYTAGQYVIWTQDVDGTMDFTMNLPSFAIYPIIYVKETIDSEWLESPLLDPFALDLDDFYIENNTEYVKIYHEINNTQLFGASWNIRNGLKIFHNDPYGIHTITEFECLNKSFVDIGVGYVITSSPYTHNSEYDLDRISFVDNYETSVVNTTEESDLFVDYDLTHLNATILAQDNRYINVDFTDMYDTGFTTPFMRTENTTILNNDYMSVIFGMTGFGALNNGTWVEVDPVVDTVIDTGGDKTYAPGGYYDSYDIERTYSSYFNSYFFATIDSFTVVKIWYVADSGTPTFTLLDSDDISGDFGTVHWVSCVYRDSQQQLVVFAVDNDLSTTSGEQCFKWNTYDIDGGHWDHASWQNIGVAVNDGTTFNAGYQNSYQPIHYTISTTDYFYWRIQRQRGGGAWSQGRGFAVRFTIPTSTELITSASWTLCTGLPGARNRGLHMGGLFETKTNGYPMITGGYYRYSGSWKWGLEIYRIQSTTGTAWVLEYDYITETTGYRYMSYGDSANEMYVWKQDPDDGTVSRHITTNDGDTWSTSDKAWDDETDDFMWDTCYVDGDLEYITTWDETDGLEVREWTASTDTFGTHYDMSDREGPDSHQIVIDTWVTAVDGTIVTIHTDSDASYVALYFSYHAFNTAPVASADSGPSADLYAGIAFLAEATYTDVDGQSDLDNVYLSFGPSTDAAGDDTFRCYYDSDSFVDDTQFTSTLVANTASGYKYAATGVPDSIANGWEVVWSLTVEFGYAFYDDAGGGYNDMDVNAYAFDDAAVGSGWDVVQTNADIEDDLEAVSLTATFDGDTTGYDDDHDGDVSDGEWFKGSYPMTFAGSIEYVGSSQTFDSDNDAGDSQLVQLYFDGTDLNTPEQDTDVDAGAFSIAFTPTAGVDYTDDTTDSIAYFDVTIEGSTGSDSTAAGIEITSGRDNEDPTVSSFTHADTNSGTGYDPQDGYDDDLTADYTASGFDDNSGSGLYDSGSYSYEWNDGGFSATTSSNTYAASTTDGQSADADLRLYDDVGNWVEIDGEDIVVDDDAPSSSVITEGDVLGYPDDNAYLTGSTIYYDTGDSDSFTISIDSTSAGNSGFWKTEVDVDALFTAGKTTDETALPNVHNCAYVGAGDGTLRIRVVNNAGNYEELTYTAIGDNIAPSIGSFNLVLTADTNTGTGYDPNTGNYDDDSVDVTTSGSVTEADSGLASSPYSYKYDGGSYQAYVSGGDTITSVPEGSRTIYIRVIDAVGNLATDLDTVAVEVDLTTPSGVSWSLMGAEIGGWDVGVYILLASPYTHIYFKNDHDPGDDWGFWVENDGDLGNSLYWKVVWDVNSVFETVEHDTDPLSESKYFTFFGDSGGTNFTNRVVNNAGNYQEYTFITVDDQTAPTDYSLALTADGASIGYTPNTGYYDDGTVDVDATDTGSITETGVGLPTNCYSFQVESQGWSSYQSSDTWESGAQSDGDFDIYVKVSDDVGNEGSAVEITGGADNDVTIDTDSPFNFNHILSLVSGWGSSEYVYYSTGTIYFKNDNSGDQGDTFGTTIENEVGVSDYDNSGFWKSEWDVNTVFGSMYTNYVEIESGQSRNVFETFYGDSGGTNLTDRIVNNAGNYEEFTYFTFDDQVEPTTTFSSLSENPASDFQYISGQTYYFSDLMSTSDVFFDVTVTGSDADVGLYGVRMSVWDDDTDTYDDGSPFTRTYSTDSSETSGSITLTSYDYVGNSDSSPVTITMTEDITATDITWLDSQTNESSDFLHHADGTLLDGITNGGFETGDFTGWTIVSGTPLTRTGEWAHSGTYGGDLSYDPCEVTQDIDNVSVDLVTEFSFWVYPYNQNAENVTIYYTDGSIDTWGPWSYASGWVQYDKTGDLDAGKFIDYISFARTDSGNVCAFDDIVFEYNSYDQYGFYSDNMGGSPATFNVGGSASDSLSGVYSVADDTTFGDDPTYTGSPELWTIAYTIDSGDSSEGSFNITYTATDNCGNTVTDWFYFYEDTINPSTTFSDLTESSEYLYWNTTHLFISDAMGATTQYFTIEVTSEDPLFSLTNPSFEDDWSSWTNSGAVGIYTDAERARTGTKCVQYQNGAGYVQQDIENTIVSDITEISFYGKRFGSPVGVGVRVTYTDVSYTEEEFVFTGYDSWVKFSVNLGLLEQAKVVDSIRIYWTDGTAYVDDVFCSSDVPVSDLYAVEFLETAWGDNSPANDTSSPYSRQFEVTLNENSTTMIIKAVDNVGNWETTLEIIIIDEGSGPNVELGVGVDEIIESSNYLYAPDNTTFWYGNDMGGDQSVNFSMIYAYNGSAGISHVNFTVAWLGSNPSDSTAPYSLVISTIGSSDTQTGTMYVAIWTNTGQTTNDTVTVSRDTGNPASPSWGLTAGHFATPYYNFSDADIWLTGVSDSGSGLLETGHIRLYSDQGHDTGFQSNNYYNLTGWSTEVIFIWYWDIRDNVYNELSQSLSNAMRFDFTDPHFETMTPSESSVYLYYSGSGTTAYYGSGMPSAQTFTFSGWANDTGLNDGRLGLINGTTAFGDTPEDNSIAYEFDDTFSLEFTIESSDNGVQYTNITLFDIYGNFIVYNFTFIEDNTVMTVAVDTVEESSSYLYSPYNTVFYYGDDMGSAQEVNFTMVCTNGSSGISHVNTTVAWFGDSPSDSTSPYYLDFDIESTDTQNGTMTVVIYSNTGQNATNTMTIFRDTDTKIIQTPGGTSESSVYLYYDESSGYGWYGDQMGSTQTFTIGGMINETGDDISLDPTYFDDLMWYLDFEEGSGTEFLDYTTNFNFTRWVTNPPLWSTDTQKAWSTYSADFETSGTFRYANNSNDDIYRNTSEGTFSVWFKVATISGAGDDVMIHMGFTGDTSGTFKIEFTGSVIRVQLHASDGAWRIYDNWGWNFVADEWHHLAVSSNDTSETYVVYLDGVALGSPQTTNGYWLNDIPAGGQTRLGCSTGSAELWGGHMDDLYYYNRTLTQAEILLLADPSASGIYSITDNTSFGDNPSSVFNYMDWDFDYTIDSADSSSGTFTVTYNITDNVGNWNTTTFEFKLDTTEPEMEYIISEEDSPYLFWDNTTWGNIVNNPGAEASSANWTFSSAGTSASQAHAGSRSFYFPTGGSTGYIQQDVYDNIFDGISFYAYTYSAGIGENITVKMTFTDATYYEINKTMWNDWAWLSFYIGRLRDLPSAYWDKQLDTVRFTWHIATYCFVDTVLITHETQSKRPNILSDTYWNGNAGFEYGNFTEWTTSGSPTISSTVVKHGQYSGVTVQGSSAIWKWISPTIGQGEGFYAVKIWYRGYLQVSHKHGPITHSENLPRSYDWTVGYVYASDIVDPYGDPLELLQFYSIAGTTYIDSIEFITEDDLAFVEWGNTSYNRRYGYYSDNMGASLTPFSINGTASDSDVGIYSITDNTTFGNDPSVYQLGNDWSFTYQIDNGDTSTGTITIFYEVTDLVGNTVNITYKMILDNTNPVISLNTSVISESSVFLYYDGSSAYGYYSDNMGASLTDFNITGTTYDIGSQIDRLREVTDNTTFGDDPSNIGNWFLQYYQRIYNNWLFNYSIDQSDDSFGTFTVSYRVYDHVNNTNTITFEFRLDNTDPTITHVSLPSYTGEGSPYLYYYAGSLSDVIDGSFESVSGPDSGVGAQTNNWWDYWNKTYLATPYYLSLADRIHSGVYSAQLQLNNYTEQYGWYFTNVDSITVWVRTHNSDYVRITAFYSDGTNDSANVRSAVSYTYIQRSLTTDPDKVIIRIRFTNVGGGVDQTSYIDDVAFSGTSVIGYNTTQYGYYSDNMGTGQVNLTNGGFETSDLTGWNTGTGSEEAGVSGSAFYIHDGSYGAHLDWYDGVQWYYDAWINQSATMYADSIVSFDFWVRLIGNPSTDFRNITVTMVYSDGSNTTQWYGSDIPHGTWTQCTFTNITAGKIVSWILFEMYNPTGRSLNTMAIDTISLISDTIFLVGGTASDGDVGLLSISDDTSFGDNPSNGGNNTIWSFMYSIDQDDDSFGSFNVTYTAIDLCNNSITTWFYFYLDDTAPTIQIDTGEIVENSPYLYYSGSGTNGYYSDNMGSTLTSFQIHGSCTDPSTASGLYVLVDNTTFGNDPTYSVSLADWYFDYQIDQDDNGNYYITYTVTDNVGHTTTTSSFYFYEDTTPPSGTYTLTQDPDALVSNWDNDTTAYTEFTSLSDGSSPPASGYNTTHPVRYKLDSGTWGDWNATVSKTWTTTEGTRVLWISFHDYVNNTVEYSITIYVDLTYPVLGILTWKNPTYSDNWYKFLDNLAQFNITWTEINQYLLNATQSSLSYEELDSSPSGSVSDFEISIIASPEGWYDVTVEIWDNAGNKDTNIYSDDADKLKLDNSAPTGSFDLFQDTFAFVNNYYHTALFYTNVTGTTDNGPSGGSGLPTNYIAYKLNTNPYSAWDSEVNEVWIGIDQFNNTLYCVLRDNVGLESTIYLDWVIVDLVAPVLGWLILNETYAPNWYDQTISSTAQASVNWVETYPYHVNATCTLAHLNDTDQSGSPSLFNFTITGESDGSYSISIIIYDRAGWNDTTLLGSEAPIQLRAGMGDQENWFYFYFFKNDATGLDWRDFNTSYVLDELYRNYTEVRMRGALYAQKYLNLTSTIRFIVRNYFGDVISNASYSLPSSFDLYITLDVNILKVANLYDEVMNMTIERQGSTQVFTEQVMPNEIWKWDMYAADYNITIYIHGTSIIALERDGTAINDFNASLSVGDYAMFVDAPLTFNTLNMIISEIWQFNILTNKDHKSLQPTVDIYMNGSGQGSGSFSPGTIVLSRPTYGYYNLTVYATWQTYTTTYQRWITVESNAEVTTWTTSGQESASDIIAIAWNTNKGTGTLRVYDNGSLIATDSVEGALTIVKSSVVGFHNLTMNVTVETRTFTAIADYTISDWSAVVEVHLYSDPAPYVSVTEIHTATLSVTRSDDETYSGWVYVNGSAVAVVNGAGTFTVVSYNVERIVYHIDYVQDLSLVNRSFIANDLTVTFDRLIGTMGIVDISSSSATLRVTFNNSYDDLAVTNFDYGIYLNNDYIKSSREVEFTLEGLSPGEYTVDLRRIRNLDNDVDTGSCNQVPFTIEAPPQILEEINEKVVQPFSVPIILVLVVVAGIFARRFFDKKKQNENGMGGLNKQIRSLGTQQKGLEKEFKKFTRRGNGR